MGREGWESLPPPGTGEGFEDAARRAYEAADPSSFSPLPPGAPLVPTGRETNKKSIPLHTDGVDTYVPLRDTRAPARQQVIARLLKGILTTADIVRFDKGKPAYYSKVMPHDRIEAKATPDTILAENELLYLLFGDIDREYRSMHGMKNLEHDGLRIADGAVSYFDFDAAELTRPAAALQSSLHTPASLEHLARKLDEVEARYEGPEGLRHLKAILESSGTSLYKLFTYSDINGSAEDFQAGLKRRIENARLLIGRAEAARG